MIVNRCSNCQKDILFSMLDNIVTLKTKLLESERDVIFCSKNCMEKKLSNLNSNTPNQFEHVTIKEQKLISENPFVLFVELEPKPIKTEIISIIEGHSE